MRRCGRGRLAADAQSHGAGMSSVGAASPRHDEYVILAIAQPTNQPPNPQIQIRLGSMPIFCGSPHDDRHPTFVCWRSHIQPWWHISRCVPAAATRRTTGRSSSGCRPTSSSSGGQSTTSDGRGLRDLAECPHAVARLVQMSARGEQAQHLPFGNDPRRHLVG